MGQLGEWGKMQGMQNKKKLKVAVALSGGVDSGVAAALLVKKGYEVTGVHLKLAEKDGNKCCDVSSFNKVVKLCEQLNIPLKVLDFSKEFADVVIHEFLQDYRRGLTPNPCVTCNKEIKIGGLLKWVEVEGYDYLATGHYCRAPVGATRGSPEFAGRSRPTPTDANAHLLQALDKSKDQSYFLWTLDKSQIAKLLFPIGNMYKKDVQDLAINLGLQVKDSSESFDVCFISDEKFGVGSGKLDTRSGKLEVGLWRFLKIHLPASAFKVGEVVNTVGEVIGEHFGLPLYTIGQRKGFLVTSKKYGGQAMFVVRKDAIKNQLVVGSEAEASTKTFKIKDYRLKIKDLNNKNLKVKIRHRGELVMCVVSVGASRGSPEFAGRSRPTPTMTVNLEQPLIGVAPGQSAVFYVGEELVGGGVIC